MELQGVLWSDWGNPERIAKTLRQIGREPVLYRAHYVKSLPPQARVNSRFFRETHIDSILTGHGANFMGQADG
jgi:hypothetical protein